MNYIQAETVGDVAIVDLSLNSSVSTFINYLNGRQGDNLRTVKFQFVQGEVPFNVQNLVPEVVGKDSAGKIKQVSGAVDIINQTAGIVKMLIPAEIYKSSGLYQEAYIRLKDSEGTVVSSVPIMFEVFANNVLVTSNVSEDYVQTIDNMIAEAAKNLADKTSNLVNELAENTAKVESQALDIKTTNDQLKQLQSDIDANNFLKKTESATLLGDIVFDGKLTSTNFSGFASTKVVTINQDSFDLNDVNVAKSYADNSVTINHVYGTNITNPVEGTSKPSFTLQTYRSGDALFQLYFSEATESIIFAKRIVSGITSATTPSFGSWTFLSGTKGWQPLTPYLTADFKRFSDIDAEPQFMKVGNLVVLRGKIATTHTISTTDSSAQFKIFSGLPFSPTVFQVVKEIGSNGRTWILNTGNNSLSLSSHMTSAGAMNDITQDLVLNLSGTLGVS